MKKDFTWIYFTDKIKSMKVALKLQAKEYERRLGDLNGEASRLRQMQQDYIPREVHEKEMNQLREKIGILESWKTRSEGRQQLIQYIPWLLTALSVYFMYTKK